MNTKKDKSSPYLTGKLLLAMPSMGDPRFHKAVIFMCSHDENGAMGLVINNHAHTLKFENLLEQLGIMSDITLDPQAAEVPVMLGGPVETGRGFLLHGKEFDHAETIAVNEGFAVTATLDALKTVAQGKVPDDMLFILGYAGWEAGQLDEEIQQNAWLVADPNPELVFENKNDEKWQNAVSALGFDPAMLSSDAGHA